ncbi:hypothetical protein BJ165DRAFT_1591052 [Panaeolus papilionaceus]|nr:hypothetical protein BJ165DRAFT_1591052 [Panaeolus papilionaceus]
MMTLDAQTIRRQYPAQPRSKHVRLHRELIGADLWGASSSSALEFTGYERQDQDGDGDNADNDGDSQGDGDSNDNDGPPLQGNRNRNNLNPSGNSNGSLAASNSNNTPVAGKNQNQNRPDDASPTTPGIVFVTIISTRTETTTVLHSTITETLTLTATNSPISRPSSTIRPNGPVPTSSANMPTADASNADSSSQAQLSGGSIAAIVIGIIIFVALIMAFAIRVMSFRRERPWTELDRGISRFRDEEEKLEYQPNLLSNGRLDDDPFEPTLPPRALRKTTIRFVTPPTLPATINEDSSLPSFDDNFLRESPFSPSTNIFTNGHRNMPRPGILLNPLSPNMPTS